MVKCFQLQAQKNRSNLINLQTFKADSESERKPTNDSLLTRFDYDTKKKLSKFYGKHGMEITTLTHKQMMQMFFIAAIQL